MKWIYIAAFCVASSASGLSTELPFEPVYSYKQRQLTYDSMAQEILQFRQLVTWHEVLGQLAIRKAELEIYRESFERGEKLFKGNQISLSDFSRRRFLFQSTQARVTELENRSEMLKEIGEVARLAVLIKGDPSDDHREEIARKMRDSMAHQRKASELSFAAADLAEKYHAGRLAAAKALLDGSYLSLDNYEKVELDHARAEAERDAEAREMAVMDEALDGLARSLDRLRAEKPGAQRVKTH